MDTRTNNPEWESITEIMGKITPLPWHAGYGDTDGGHFSIYEEKHIDTGIVTVPICRLSPEEDVNETDKANAAYIIRACNEFPNLVQTLDRLNKAFMNLDQIPISAQKQRSEAIIMLRHTSIAANHLLKKCKQ